MSRTDVTPTRPAPASSSLPRASADHQAGPQPDRDGLAEWVLRGPLACALGGLVAFQLATWVPHYLTWPLWADHDVFATMAIGWDAGRLPYRDLRSNNFPGPIYLFWALGKAFGWGETVPFYAADAAMVVALGGLLVAWSRRRLGMIVPGLVGYLTFLSYYLGLDYSHAAQRDWQGPFFAVLGVLVVQGWPGRAGRLVSAWTMAAAIAYRPQTVLFLPALALAIDEAVRRPGEPPGKTIRALAAWSLALGLGLALAFAPLIVAGVAGDFVRGVRLAAYGAPYNRVTPVSIASGWLAQVAPLRIALVPPAIVLLARRAGPDVRRLAWAWLAALGAVSLYKPLSPVPHTYLNIPLTLVWSIALAVLAHLVLSRPAPATLRLAAALMVLAPGVTARPELCAFGPTARALAALGRGGLASLEETPPGYRHGTVPTSAFYPWRDYRAVVDYLRRETGPATRVANVLKGDPAITAPAARTPVFPAESVTWLRMVRPDDEAEFADALARARDSVVVWAPGEVGPDPDFTLERIAGVIRAHYRPEARFGIIEVWRRKDEPGPRPTAGVDQPSWRVAPRDPA